MKSDRELLEKYVRHGSQDAFRELVNQHLGLIHSSALRLVNGDAHLAQDIAQLVFANLARQAAKLPRTTILAGWLHRDTCYTALDLLRKESRRRVREKEAVAMNELEREAVSVDWQQVRPFLDQALEQLHPTDRDALLLRFFEQRSLAEIGERFGVGESGVSHRISRALEKLRDVLVSRGVTTTAATLSVLLAANGVQPIPAGLATALASASLANSMTTTISAVGLTQLMTSAKIKIALVTMALGGMVVPFVHQQQLIKRQRAENSSLRLQLESAGQAVAPGSDGQQSRQSRPDGELQRLRGEVTLLRRQLAEASQAARVGAKVRGAQQPASEEEQKSEEEKWRELGLQRLNYTKQWMLAFMLFAVDNERRLPETFNEATNYFGNSVNDSETYGDSTPDQFEIVYNGSLKDVVAPARTIVIRQKIPDRKADGSLHKAYGFADGHSEYHREGSDGFDKWEQDRMQQTQ